MALDGYIELVGSGHRGVHAVCLGLKLDEVSGVKQLCRLSQDVDFPLRHNVLFK